jgi:hypothetical protein
MPAVFVGPGQLSGEFLRRWKEKKLTRHKNIDISIERTCILAFGHFDVDDRLRVIKGGSKQTKFLGASLQQVEVSIRTIRSFNLKLRKSRLELTEINLRFKLINHVMRTTLHAREFSKGGARDGCRPAYSI